MKRSKFTHESQFFIIGWILFFFHLDWRLYFDVHPWFYCIGSFEILTLDLYFVKHWYFKVLLFFKIPRNWYFHDSHCLFSALSFDFLLHFNGSFNICCSFQHIFPLIVCTSNVKHGLIMTFLDGNKLNRNCQNIWYWCFPWFLISLICYYFKAIMNKLFVLKYNFNFFYNFFRIGIFEFNYF